VWAVICFSPGQRRQEELREGPTKVLKTQEFSVYFNILLNDVINTDVPQHKETAINLAFRSLHSLNQCMLGIRFGA
jgi:hypothetical protein